MGHFGSGFPDSLVQLDAATQRSFLPSLSLPHISDLHCSLVAFSAFATSLSIFLTGLSTNQSLSPLILLLSTSWKSWNNTLREQLPCCFHFYSSACSAFIIETSPNVLLLYLTLEPFPLSCPVFCHLHALFSPLSPRRGENTAFSEKIARDQCLASQFLLFLSSRRSRSFYFSIYKKTFYNLVQCPQFYT